MCRILVVDEQAVVRELVAEVLAWRGHEAVCADSEEEALAFLSQNHVDVLLMDVPRARAGRVRLRDDARLRHTPMVLLEEGGDGGLAEPKGAGGEAEPSDEVAHVDLSHFRLDDLLMRVDQCLGVEAARGGERRSRDRVPALQLGLTAHMNGMGPWRVVDVSAEGIGVAAGTRFEIGDCVQVLLRDETIPYGGRMLVRHREGCGGGRYHYGLLLEERASVLGRGLASISARLQRAIPSRRAAWA